MLIMYSVIILLVTLTGFQCKIIELQPVEELKDALTNSVWTYECHESKGCKKVEISEKITKCENEKEINTCKNETINRRLLSKTVCNLLCPPGNLWPQPNGDIHISNTYIPINGADIQINLSQSKTRTDAETKAETSLKEAAELFRKHFQTLSKTKKNYDQFRNVIITLDLTMPDVFKFETGTDESYSLCAGLTDNNSINITISGSTFFGVRHGLETLSQLLVYDNISGNVVMPSQVIITDKPVYTHRGITLDTSRNYISIPSIIRTIDAMSAVKMNTLHWHITDSHSFPFVSKSYPLFSKYGAYSEEKVYTEEDISVIVEYARIRGIRIIPELDLPAHVGEGWQSQPGAVVCFNAQPWIQYCVEPPCGQVDPTEDNVYKILSGLFTDLNRAFEADLFHMGGDEVNLNCWNTTAKLVKNMEKLGFHRTKEGFHDLWSYFQTKAKDLVKSTGGENKQIVLWTSSLTEADLDKYLNKSEYIIQVWTKGDDPTITNLLKKGFRIILSNYDALYFDCGFGAWVGSGNNWCSPYIPWQKVYENTPKKILHKLGLENDYEHLILGSEAALWTEQADDSSIDNRLWPRSAALAESLWSPGNSWQTAEKRYLIQRERFVQSGILADTVQPEWCRQNEGDCYL